MDYLKLVGVLVLLFLAILFNCAWFISIGYMTVTGLLDFKWGLLILGINLAAVHISYSIRQLKDDTFKVECKQPLRIRLTLDEGDDK